VPGLAQVTFLVDGAVLSTFIDPPYQTWWVLSPGVHRFWAEGITIGGEPLKSETVTIAVVE
jgi:hypothetical protein